MEIDSFSEESEELEELEDISKIVPFLDSLEFHDSNTLSNVASLCSKEVISRIESHVLMFLKMLTEGNRIYELQPVFFLKSNFLTKFQVKRDSSNALLVRDALRVQKKTRKVVLSSSKTIYHKGRTRKH